MYSTTASLATFISFLLPLASATFSFNSTFSSSDNSTVSGIIYPSLGVSDACTKAYAMSLDCTENFYSLSGLEESSLNATLEERCTDSCLLSLRKWRDTLRSDCTAEDIQKANATVIDYEEGEIYEEGPQVLAMMANKDVAAIEYLYWTYCMRDLETNEFCILDPSVSDSTLYVPANTTDKNYNASVIPAFCDSSCVTQMSAFIYEIATSVDEVSGSSSPPDIADARKICPDVDVANFPLVKSLEAVDSSSSSSGSSGNSSGSPNAASSLKAVSLVGSTLLIGAVVALGLL